MIKLERIHVKNYKNIAEADLELGQMNVVVGENNSGKSNLLEVIPLLNYIINGPVNDVKRGFEWGGLFENFSRIRFVSGLNLSPKSIHIDIDFSNTDTGKFYSYSVELGFKGGKEASSFAKMLIAKEAFSYKSKTSTGKPVTIFSRDLNSIKYGVGFKKIDIIKNVENEVSIVRLLSIINWSENAPKEYVEGVNMLNKILGLRVFYLSPHLLKEVDIKVENQNRLAFFDMDAEIVSLNKNPVLWSQYGKVLLEVLKIEAVALVDMKMLKDDTLKKVAGFLQRGMIKYMPQLSDGSAILVALITKLFSDSSDIFFIEEPENSIHPRALSELMKLIRAKALDKQFIITTHSPYLLNMIKPEEVFVASVNKEGRSEIGKLPNVKAIKKKLAKSFMDFGDIVFSEPDTDEDGE